jgi:RNA polymerase sigma factor (sigma-70 family)
MSNSCDGCHYAQPAESDANGVPETEGIERSSRWALTAGGDLGPVAEWPDQFLVQSCLEGNERAWETLLGRYKNLICSFPRRYGAAPSDAADVFQLVSAELFVALPRLRNQHSVRSWIMTVAAHQACQWKRRHLTRTRREGDPLEDVIDTSGAGPSTLLEDADRDRVVREALGQLPPRCQKLLRLLFYKDPPLPYNGVAGHLGLATGSVGFIRARCLRRLERVLGQAGIGAVTPLAATRTINVG